MGKRILLVDDSSFMRNMIKRILNKNGFTIVGEANNGLDGVKKYKELHPDIVMMDVVMDKMTGVDAVKEIKQYDPNAIVIMCTSMGQQCILQEALDNGARDFVIKPFHEGKLLDTINRKFED